VKTLQLRLLVTATSGLLLFGGGANMAAEVSSADKFEWLTDYKRAQEESKATNKPLLIEFTGSDWCPPCKQMQKEVLGTAEFQSYAAKNFILLEVDFPRTKEQPHDLAAQNMELAQRFEVQGFPSILVLGSDGAKLGERVGYDPGEGATGFIAWLEKMRKG
jgi:thioredoxin-related protein